jgi:hypothetical protein
MKNQKAIKLTSKSEQNTVKCKEKSTADDTLLKETQKK